MKKLLGSICLSALVGLAAPAQADNLFKSYKFGQSKASFTSDEQFYDCSDILENSLCTDVISFNGNDFEAVFSFIEDKLVNIMLVDNYSEDLYLNTFAALNSSFSLVAMQDAKDRFDLLEERHRVADQDELEAKLAKFESIALDNAELTYIFLEGDARRFLAKKNVVSAIQQSPAGVREADMRVFANDDEVYISVVFSQPKLMQQQLQQRLTRKVEDF